MIKINPDKLAKTLQLNYKLEKNKVYLENGQKIDSYIFDLGDDKKERAASLWFSQGLNEVNLTIIAKNEYRSTVNFTNVTKVIYIPKYRAIRFESHTGNYFSILKVYWRGQFDLFNNWSEKNYKETVWAKRKDC